MSKDFKNGFLKKTNKVVLSSIIFCLAIFFSFYQLGFFSFEGIKKAWGADDTDFAYSYVGIAETDAEAGNLLPAKLTKTDGEFVLQLQRIISDSEKGVVDYAKVTFSALDAKLVKKVKGKLLLNVEGAGEVWYVFPSNGKKIYAKDGQAAYEILSATSIGIKPSDLDKIKLGYDERLSQGLVDTDNDGLPDVLEEAIGSDKTKSDTDGDGYSDLTEYKSGYKLTGSSRYPVDNGFANKLAGVYLNVQNGTAWYVNNGLRYYISPKNAYNAMKFLSLGITMENLNKIPVFNVSGK